MLAPKAIKRKIQAICERLILDRLYLVSVQKKLREGRMPPQMEAVIWYYAFGKPVEKIEVEEKRSIRIIHEYIQADLLPENVEQNLGQQRLAATFADSDLYDRRGADTVEFEAGRVPPQ